MGSINESGHVNVCPRLTLWMACSWIPVTVFFDKSLTYLSPKTLECTHINYKEQREPSTWEFLTRASSHRWPSLQGLLIGDGVQLKSSWFLNCPSTGSSLFLVSQALDIISTLHCCLPDQRARDCLCVCVFSSQKREKAYLLFWKRSL